MVQNSLYLIKKKGIVQLDNSQITAQLIGGKALGLCQIPVAWSVPFFVISQDLFNEYVLYEDESVVYSYTENIKTVINLLSIKKNIILRSSAVNEGMKERGRFDSIETTTDNIESALINLLNKLKNIPNNGMPIIVQELVSSVFAGHLSNERRFSQESRDWKVEIYYENGDFDQDTIGIRTWRTRYDATEIVRYALVADQKSVISELHKVAFYWYNLSKNMKCRFHLEFVFDGKTIYIVQADPDFPKENSVNPKLYNIKVNQLSGKWIPKLLKIYDPSKTSRFKKLQNVKNYNDLGFCTVPLYFLDDINILTDLSNGIVCSDLKEDIITLLNIQPVVIRMDIIATDKSQNQMLPRSNEIREYKDVIVWLKKHVNIILGEKQGIFIFHNFVPAISSAFAHAIPNSRLVKIQSLWGLPEGLYYNYHDTIIVDLGSKNLDTITESDVKVTIKNRYKDIFIHPDEDGNWVAHSIKEPYDWKCSIENNRSIFEIAVKSQKLANKTQQEISVMWFIGIDDSFYGESNLPWFHEKVSFASYTIDEYKRKYFTEEEIIINNGQDLQELISSGNIKNKRCIRLKPNCEKDLRNKDLIVSIGRIAADNDIMILLDGTQLTHSYYQLKSTGAKVVCSDKNELLYSDTVEFNKLVRDKIPEKIISNGEHVECSKIARPLFDRLLLEKLLEEAYEVNDAQTTDDIIAELADLTELCNTIKNINSKNHISCQDILNNKKNIYKDGLNNFVTFAFPVTDPEYIISFKFKGLFGSIYIQRMKTIYRVELNLQNYPLKNEKDIVVEDNNLIKKIKALIVSEVSLSLNSRKSDTIIRHIKKIESLVEWLCKELNISLLLVEQKRKNKQEKVGGFKKGYILKQTTLKDNIIDDNSEFNPENCSEIYAIERDISKYCELLQNHEKGQKRLLLRFSAPISVNNWEIVFDNPKIEQMLSNIQSLFFEIHKNSRGKLSLTISGLSKTSNKQLSFFDV